ncbi:hypothetical protein [Rhodoferax sp. WC2427]|uniref:hypothetical protein n=1 Tax=Rhodoferax sp. WC2427 TaxID=3234144 RepID=UPI003465FAD4
MKSALSAALFVMAQPDTFTWPVNVRVPLNGTYGQATFTGEFPNMADAERDALVASDASGAAQFTNVQVADKVLISFSDLKMPDGSTLPFTPENKAALLAQPRVANAVVGTFLAVTRGVAAEKNA